MANFKLNITIRIMLYCIISGSEIHFGDGTHVQQPCRPVLPALETVSLERDGHVLLIGLNRPQKRNSFDRTMLADLSRAYALLEADTSVRAGVLFAHGDHFTAGLDLADVGPGIAAG